jgi:hypothetical protein
MFRRSISHGCEEAILLGQAVVEVVMVRCGSVAIRMEVLAM